MSCRGGFAGCKASSSDNLDLVADFLSVWVGRFGSISLTTATIERGRRSNMRCQCQSTRRCSRRRGNTCPEAAEQCSVKVVALQFLLSRPIQQGGRSHEKTRVDFDYSDARAGNDGVDGQCANPATWRGGPACAGSELHADNPAGCLWGIWPSVRPGLDLLLWQRSLWTHLLWVPPLPVSTAIKQPQYSHWRPPSGGLVLFGRTMRLKTPRRIQATRRTALHDGKAPIHHKCGAGAHSVGPQAHSSRGGAA